MRVIFYTLLSLLGISLSLVIIAPSLFDIKSYKNKIEEIVFLKTGNILNLNGDISLSILSGVKLKVDKIEYKINNGDRLFISDELIISPDIFSLIKGNIIFKSLKLVNPIFYITNNDTENSNWSKAFKNNNNTTKNSKEKNLSKKNENILDNNKKNLNPLNINYLTIKNAKIKYDIKDNKIDVNDIDLVLNFVNPNEYKIKGSFKYKKEKINILYDLKYDEANTELVGNIKGDTIEVSNNTKIDLNRLIGTTDLKINIQNLSNLSEERIIFNMPIVAEANIDFNKEKFIVKDSKVLIKKNLINLNGEYIKKNKSKIVNISIKSPKLYLDDFIFKKNYKKKGLEKKKETKQETIKEIKQKKDHTLDILFNYLKDYRLSSNIFINEIVFKNKHIYKGFDLKLYTKKDINIDLNLKNIFDSKLKFKSVIKNNKEVEFKLLAKGINIEKFNNLNSYNYLSGYSDLSLNAYSKLIKKDIFLKNLNGELIVDTQNIIIKNIDLQNLKSNILAIDEINDLVQISENIFNGNTQLMDKKFKIKLVKGNLILPETNVKINNGDIKLKGSYEILKKYLDTSINFDTDNKLLSLFLIKFSGNINDIKTNFNYDKNITEKMVQSIVENKLKKVIKEKLDNKFNDVLDNLLN